MFQEEFTKLCNLHHCEYTHDSYQVDGEIGSFIHISDHYLKIIHNNITIDITYNLGNSNVAEYNIDICPLLSIPNFKLSTVENIIRLFLNKKSPWKIKCSNPSLLSLIKNELKKSDLTKLANKTAFEPVIKGKMINSTYNINTKFYIGYKYKIESISTILDFHKNLIDILLSKYY